MLSGNPWLRSTSTQILAKVKILFKCLSVSIFNILPRVFPIADKDVKCQKCIGRLCNLTHTGILDTTMVFRSNSGNQGVTNNPALPQNHGPSVRAFSLSSSTRKTTMKKPFEHRCIRQFVVHVVWIHWYKASDLGQKPLNLQIMTFFCRSENMHFTSGISNGMEGLSGTSSTIYCPGGILTVACSFPFGDSFPFAASL